MKFLINKFIFRYKDVLICSDEGDNIFVLFHILTSEKVDPAYAPSDESISHIGGDTELEIEIRNNIVQEFTKRHLKGLVETETIKQAITDTKLMVVNYAKKEVAEQIGEVKRSYGSTTYKLQDDVVEAIKDQISKAMKREVYDHIENLVKTYVGKLDIKKYINQMIDFNIKQTVEEGIRERFEAMLKKTSK